MKFQTPKKFHGRVHGPSVVEFLFESDALAGHFDAGKDVEESAHDIFSSGMLDEKSRPGTWRSCLASIGRHQTVQHFGHRCPHVRILQPVGRAHENDNQSQQIVQLATVQRAGRESVDEDDEIHHVGQNKFGNATQHIRRVFLV